MTMPATPTSDGDEEQLLSVFTGQPARVVIGSRESLEAECMRDHNYIGHNYIGHNYKRLEADCMRGHNYIGHNYIVARAWRPIACVEAQST